MSSFRLELVTEHQHKKEKAEQLGKALANLLHLELTSVRRYSKFDSSYRIELKGNFPEEENKCEYAIKLTHCIANNWLTNYDVENNQYKPVII